MTRINESLLVQRVGDLIVVVDESTGVEAGFPVTDTEKVIQVLMYLATNDLAAARAFALPD
jgi:hypothetical protein